MIPFFILTTLSTALMPSGYSTPSCWNIMGAFPLKNPTSDLHYVRNSFSTGTTVFSFFWHRYALPPLLLNWIHFQIFSLTSVSLFILTISLMALDLSIGYSIFPKVTRYRISNVAEFVSFPTWIFTLVHPRNGIYVLLLHCSLKLYHYLISLSMVSLLVQDNSSLNSIFLQ